eukprot:scaffold8070_cov117-Cylindrotheca_fusiformis.AAC.8
MREAESESHTFSYINTSSMVKKDEWREFHIYQHNDDDDEDEEGKDDEETAEEYAGNFDLFGNLQDSSNEEMMEFSFQPNNGVIVDDDTDETIHITLKGFQDYTQSTGMAVWLGSEVIAHHLVQNVHMVRNKSVLELGAGLGLAGIVAHRLKASTVVLTDGDTAVLNGYLKFNASLNKSPDSCSNSSGTLESAQLIWGNQGHDPDSDNNPLVQFRNQYGLFDVIIATDCTYMPQSLVPFWQTIDALLKPRNEHGQSGVFLYVMEAATQAPLENVLKVGESLGFEWTLETIPTIEEDPQDKDKMHDIYTFRRSTYSETS